MKRVNVARMRKYNRQNWPLRAHIAIEAGLLRGFPEIAEWSLEAIQDTFARKWRVLPHVDLTVEYELDYNRYSIYAQAREHAYSSPTPEEGRRRTAQRRHSGRGRRVR